MTGNNADAQDILQLVDDLVDAARCVDGSRKLPADERDVIYENARVARVSLVEAIEELAVDRNRLAARVSELQGEHRASIAHYGMTRSLEAYFDACRESANAALIETYRRRALEDARYCDKRIAELTTTLAKADQDVVRTEAALVSALGERDDALDDVVNLRKAAKR